jgi:hypothetical protein
MGHGLESRAVDRVIMEHDSLVDRREILKEAFDRWYFETSRSISLVELAEETDEGTTAVSVSIRNALSECLAEKFHKTYSGITLVISTVYVGVEPGEISYAPRTSFPFSFAFEIRSSSRPSNDGVIQKYLFDQALECAP